MKRVAAVSILAASCASSPEPPPVADPPPADVSAAAKPKPLPYVVHGAPSAGVAWPGTLLQTHATESGRAMRVDVAVNGAWWTLFDDVLVLPEADGRYALTLILRPAGASASRWPTMVVVRASGRWTAK